MAMRRDAFWLLIVASVLGIVNCVPCDWLDTIPVEPSSDDEAIQAAWRSELEFIKDEWLTKQDNCWYNLMEAEGAMPCIKHCLHAAGRESLEKIQTKPEDDSLGQLY